MKREDVIGINERVRQFIAENFYVANAAELAGEASLIATGVIDSTGVLELISFLESEYGISIADDEVTPENLETIDSITRFVTAKQKQSAAIDASR